MLSQPQRRSIWDGVFPHAGFLADSPFGMTS